MALNILKLCIIVVFLVLSTFLFKIFNDVNKNKKIVKQIFTGLFFGFFAIGCNFLPFNIGDNSIILSDIVLAVSGLIFGGVPAIISAVMCGGERIFSIFYGTIPQTHIAMVVSLMFTGIFVTLFRSFVVKDDKIKWLYGLVVGLIVSVFYMLMLFLTNISSSTQVYQIVSDIAIANILIKTISITVILLVLALILTKNTFKVERPLHIQSKVQISLGLAIIVGFIAVTGIAFGVLKNNSKQSTKSTIEISINDIENNLVSDINNEITTVLQKTVNSMKQSIIHVYPQEKTLRSIADLYNFTELSFMQKDGTIIVSTDSLIKTFSNISQLKITQFYPTATELAKMETLVLPYQFVEQKNEYVKFAYRQYNANYNVLSSLNTQAYQEYLNKSISKGIASRHLGENGFVIVCDKDKNVLSSPTELIGKTIDIDLNNKNTISIFNLNGVEYYSYVENYVGFNIIALMNKEDCDLNMNISLCITALTEVMVFFLLYCIIFFAISKSVIKPLDRVNKSLDSICGGKLDEKVSEYSSSELKVLSNDINSTVDSLKEYMGKEAKLIQKELNFAKEIQLSALPSTFPPFPTHKEFDIYALMSTAKEVGGDFYDFYLVDDNNLCVLIADVSGKGVPASLFMMQSKTIIKSLIESKMPIDKAFIMANNKLCENNTAQMFVTAWCGILNLKTGKLQFVNAGHNPPLIKQNNSFSYLKNKVDFVLAGMEDTTYYLHEVNLSKGDEILLYTDGITEATSISKELFGEKRLLDTANSLSVCSSQEMCEQVLKNVEDFTIGAEQSDDITMLCLKIN